MILVNSNYYLHSNSLLCLVFLLAALVDMMKWAGKNPFCGGKQAKPMGIIAFLISGIAGILAAFAGIPELGVIASISIIGGFIVHKLYAKEN